MKPVGAGCRRNPFGEHQGNDLPAFPYAPAGALLKMGMSVLEEAAVTDTQTLVQHLYMKAYIHTHTLTSLSP